MDENKEKCFSSLNFYSGSLVLALFHIHAQHKTINWEKHPSITYEYICIEIFHATIYNGKTNYATE